MGLFAGSLTSTPALQAALDAAGDRGPAIGSSVAYPFGVMGVILVMVGVRLGFRISVAKEAEQPRRAPPSIPLR